MDAVQILKFTSSIIPELCTGDKEDAKNFVSDLTVTFNEKTQELIFASKNGFEGCRVELENKEILGNPIIIGEMMSAVNHPNENLDKNYIISLATAVAIPDGVVFMRIPINGNLDFKTVQININDVEKTYEIQQATRIETIESNITIYPNPVRNLLTISGINEPTVATVCSVSGSIMQITELNSGSTEINVNNLANGVYILKLQTATNVVVKRFIKQ